MEAFNLHAIKYSRIEKRINRLVMHGHCILNALKSGAVTEVATMLALKLSPDFITAFEMVAMKFITDVDRVDFLDVESKKWFAHIAVNLPHLQDYSQLEMQSINASVDNDGVESAIKALVDCPCHDELSEAIYLIFTRNHPTLIQLFISAISFAFTRYQQSLLLQDGININTPRFSLVQK